MQELSFFTTVPCQQAFSSHRLEPASFEHLVLAPLREPKSHHSIAVRSKFMKNLQPQIGPGQNSFFSFFILVIIAFIIFYPLFYHLHFFYHFRYHFLNHFLIIFIIFYFFLISFHHFCFQWCKSFQKNGKLQFSSIFFHFLSFCIIFHHFCFQWCKNFPEN